MTSDVRIDRATGLYHWRDGTSLPSVTHILKTVLPELGAWSNEEALARGRIVHHATALVDGLEEGKSLDWSTLDPDYHGYVHAWEEFKRISGFVPTRIEQQARSTIHRYAGTPDRVGVMHKRKVLLDLKTQKGSGGAEDWWPLQTAAYMFAVNEQFRDGVTERYSVILRPTGKASLIPWRCSSDWPTFLSMLNVYHWKEERK